MSGYPMFCLFKRIAKRFLVFLLLVFWVPLTFGAIISPWGEATLKSYDILLPNSGGLDLIIDGNTAFLAAERQGLYILDTSDLDEIIVKYQLTQSDFGLSGFSLYTIAKFGNYLYCGFRRTSGTLEGYLKVVNLENMDSTGPVVEIDDLYFSGSGGRLTGLFLSAETQELYAALRLGGLALIDISTPSSPSLIGQFDPGTIEHQQVIVDKVHNRAYFGGWFRGVGSVDITDADPNNWTEVFVDDASANDRYWYLVQKDQYLYASIADSPSDNTFDEGLAIYDLTENYSDANKLPSRIGFAAIPKKFQCESAAGGKDEGLVGGDPAPHQIYLKDNYAIVGNGCMGIAIFDITEPENPFFIKAYEIPGQSDLPWSVGFSGNSLITVGRNKNNSVNNDVYVFDVSPVTFAFDEQVEVPLSNMTYSNVVTLRGLGIPTDISISGGEYSINGGAFTMADGLVSDGDSIQVRLISSSDNNVSIESKVTIGRGVDVFKVTTIAVDLLSNDGASDSVSDQDNSGSLGLIELLLLSYLLFSKIVLRSLIKKLI